LRGLAIACVGIPVLWYTLVSFNLDPTLWNNRGERIAKLKREGETIVAAIDAWRARQNKLPVYLHSLDLKDPGLKYWAYQTGPGNHYTIRCSFRELFRKSSTLVYENDDSHGIIGWTMTNDIGELTRP